jgi:hypothetical protein
MKDTPLSKDACSSLWTSQTVCFCVIRLESAGLRDRRAFLPPRRRRFSLKKPFLSPQSGNCEQTEKKIADISIQEMAGILNEGERSIELPFISDWSTEDRKAGKRERQAMGPWCILIISRITGRVGNY